MNRQRLISSLIEHEGIRNLVYEDSVGVLTIGIGHNVEDVPLSNRAIEVICEDDIAIAEGELDKNWANWKRDLSDPRQNVLIEMVFNLGYPRFSKFVKFIKAVVAHDYETASIEMLESRWAEQVGRRAVNLANQMRTGQYYDA
jgi:lysozyme